MEVKTNGTKSAGLRLRTKTPYPHSPIYFAFVEEGSRI
jgi:hypothetical protein